MNSTQVSHQIVEGVSLRLTPAPQWKRALALLVDMGVIGAFSYVFVVVSMIVFGLLAAALSFSLPKGNDSLWTALGIVGIIVVALILIAYMSLFHFYFVYFEYKKGATLGKKVFGLKVVSVGSPTLSLGNAVLRDMIRWYVDALLILPAIVSMAVTERRQRLGDLAAGTMVIHSAAREAESNYTYLSSAEYLALRERFPLGEIDSKLKDSFLRFSFSYFVMKAKGIEAATLEQWVTYLVQTYPQLQDPSLSPVAALAYFAEYCSQQNTKPNKKVKIS